jgi:hypothetical protein
MVQARIRDDPAIAASLEAGLRLLVVEPSAKPGSRRRSAARRR